MKCGRVQVIVEQKGKARTSWGKVNESADFDPGNQKFIYLKPEIPKVHLKQNQFQISHGQYRVL